MHEWFLIKGIFFVIQESVRAELSKIKSLCVCVRVCALYVASII